MEVAFQFDPKATVEALLVIAGRVQTDKYVACKVLFLADRLHLVRYGRTITGATYRALKYGPVPSEPLDMLNHLVEGQWLRPEWADVIEGRFEVLEGPNPILRPARGPDFTALSDSDVQAIEEVIENREGKLDFQSLYEETHAMPEYRQARQREPLSNNPRMRFEDFFEGNADVVPGILAEVTENAALGAQCRADAVADDIV